MKIGFLGAGGIARSHAYALEALKFYYNNVPPISLESVCSSKAESRENFAARYNFRIAQDIKDFEDNNNINTVFILSPNNVHFEHFKLALEMPSVEKIYLEKPVCASLDEEQEMARLISKSNKKVQVGFQYLQTSSIRAALKFWKSGILGRPVHFDLKYYHGDYLQNAYREKRRSRLIAAPGGGSMADLGSHGISLLMAFLGEKLQIMNALQGGNFTDVPADSDLFSSLALFDPETKAVGNMSASRISSGTGDLVYFELFAEKGSLRYSSQQSECFEFYLEETGQWVKQPVGSNYESITSFPNQHVPPGWLRSMVHAHYIFLTGNDPDAFVPDLKHGLAVQRIVRETAGFLEKFRKVIS